MYRVLLSLLLLFFMVNVNFCRPATKKVSNRIVETSDGALRAVVISRPGLRSVVSVVSDRLKAVVILRPGLRSVEAFLGVQYATADRFRRPTKSTQKWQGIRVTRDFGPVCPQRIPDMDPISLEPVLQVPCSSKILVRKF